MQHAGRFIAAVLAGGMIGAFALTVATPAQAETLHRRGHAKTVRIVPAAAPARAKVSAATITVKKGTKVLAKDVASYRATPGNYRVTSQLSYRTRNSHAATATEVSAQCKISDKQLVSDDTSWRGFFGSGYYTGDVTLRYTGTCVDDLWAGTRRNHYTWQASWVDVDSVITPQVDASADRAAVVLDSTTYAVGDVDAVDGTALSALPTITTLGPEVVTTTTRTVRVR